ncbi:hypothetical protein ABZS63_39520, partial [Streptomyces sp. NPDC005568]
MAAQQQRPRAGRSAFVAAAIVTSLALASGPVHAVSSGALGVADPPAPEPAATAPASTAPAAAPAPPGAGPVTLPAPVTPPVT